MFFQNENISLAEVVKYKKFYNYLYVIACEKRRLGAFLRNVSSFGRVFVTFGRQLEGVSGHTGLELVEDRVVVVAGVTEFASGSCSTRFEQIFDLTTFDLLKTKNFAQKLLSTLTTTRGRTSLLRSELKLLCIGHRVMTTSPSFLSYH